MLVSFVLTFGSALEYMASVSLVRTVNWMTLDPAASSGEFRTSMRPFSRGRLFTTTRNLAPSAVSSISELNVPSSPTSKLASEGFTMLLDSTRDVNLSKVTFSSTASTVTMSVGLRPTTAPTRRS